MHDDTADKIVFFGQADDLHIVDERGTLFGRSLGQVDYQARIVELSIMASAPLFTLLFSSESFPSR